MTARIVLCTQTCATALGDLAPQTPAESPVRTLAQIDRGLVIALDDASLLQLTARIPDLPLLYLSLADYRAAIAGLDESERALALSLRLDWSEQADGRLAAWLVGREDRCLLLAAALSAAGAELEAKSGMAPTPSGEALAAIWAQTLAIQIALAGGSALALASVAEVLQGVQEESARLLAELQQFTPAAAEIGARRAALATLLQLAEQLGRPDLADAPPVVLPTRGLWIAPADAELQTRLAHTRVPFIPWRDGLVAPWPAHRLDTLTAGGYRTRLLYHDASALHAALDEQTPAQQARILEQRLARARAAPQTLLDEYLNRLRLGQFLLLAQLQQRAAADAPALATPLAPLLREAAAMLRTALTHAPVLPGVDTAPPAGNAPEAAVTPVRLQACAEAALAETEALMRLAQARGRAEVAAHLQQVIVVQRERLARLPPATGQPEVRRP